MMKMMPAAVQVLLLLAVIIHAVVGQSDAQDPKPAAVVVANSAAELTALTADNPVVVVVFAKAADTPAAMTHAAVAEMRRNFKSSHFMFVRVSQESAYDGAEGSIVVYKHFDERRDAFHGDITSAAEVSAFLNATCFALFSGVEAPSLASERALDTFLDAAIERSIPFGFLLVNFSHAHADGINASVAAVALQRRGQASFMWLSAEIAEMLDEKFMFPKGIFPALVMYIPNPPLEGVPEMYVLTRVEAFTSAGVDEFVASILAGTATPTVPSEKAPLVLVENGLTTVVGSTFNELVLHSGQDVLVMLDTNQWCRTAFREVAKLLEGVGGIRVACMDVSTNGFDRVRFPVTSFPAVSFVSSSGGLPIQFHGTQDLAGILQFLKAHSSIDVALLTTAPEETIEPFLGYEST